MSFELNTYSNLMKNRHYAKSKSLSKSKIYVQTIQPRFVIFTQLKHYILFSTVCCQSEFGCQQRKIYALISFKTKLTYFCRGITSAT